jgi:hypothetical protein
MIGIGEALQTLFAYGFDCLADVSSVLLRRMF